ncbi:MAG: enoyl-CoA hydratase/isomerase family protein [Acetobacteraceae bacterium]|nr:enoyl-CoA hydratase/isomerase family protein [Acetobacteraceae bacterium]
MGPEAALTPRARQVMDVSGGVIAPGYIEPHTHAVLANPVEFAGVLLRGGTTTAVVDALPFQVLVPPESLPALLERLAAIPMALRWQIRLHPPAFSGEERFALEWLRTLWRLPSVAAVSGVAIGSGLTLALACDLRVASELSLFWLPDVAYGGFLGDSGLGRLVRAVGPGAARELLLTGRRVGAARALELGLVSQVVPPRDVLAAALRLAEELAQGAPASIALARRAVDRAALGSRWAWGRELGREARAVKRAAWTRDAFEGLTAHLDGRPPRFEGR